MNFTVPKLSESEQERILVKKIPNNDKENEDVKSKSTSLTISALPEARKKHGTENGTEKNCAQIYLLSENYADNYQPTDNSGENHLNGNEAINGNSNNGNEVETDSGVKKKAWSERDYIRVDADIFIGYSTTPGMSLRHIINLM